ncbi:MAG: EAL domain-containing protein [Magnetospirillum sp.]|nr:EAL domain-containing protein [Magnetospirillum sp.]
MRFAQLCTVAVDNGALYHHPRLSAGSEDGLSSEHGALSTAAAASLAAGGSGLTRDGDLLLRLAETEARLASLTNTLPGIVFQRTMTSDGAIAYPFFSEGVREVLGFAPQSMAVNSAGCLHAVHWADRDGHVAAIRRSAAELSPCRESFRAITESGEVRWLEGSSQPRRRADGTVLWDGVLVDVTASRRAEFRLEMLMEHAADAIVLLDGGGAIDTVNAAAEQLFGWGAAELAGNPFTTLLPPAPAHLDRLLGDPLDPDSGIVGGDPHELTGLRKDGSTFPLEVSTSELRMEGHRLFVVIGRDITRRKQTEAALHESEQRLRAIAANLPGIVFQRILRSSGRLDYSYVSEGCRSFLGLEPEDLLADPELFLRALTDEERQGFYTALGRSARTLEPFEEDMASLGGDGRRRWLRGQSRPTVRANGDIVWDGVMLDVTDRKTAEQRLSFLAYYDPLTRLPNRPAFVEHFTAAADAARHAHGLLAVVSLGIDRFGVINATMGHAVGDQVLIAAADLLQSAIGSGNVMARASGDRFLILVTGYSVKRELVETIEAIHAGAQAMVTVAGEQFEIYASMGAAVFPRDGEDVETLIRNADAALQRAKGQGPATLQFFTKEMSAKASKTLSLQTKLRRGIDNGELIPYYQPQVDLISGRVVGMEALVRWLSPDLGMVSPVEFIPVAEESGLIDAVCESMLSQCAHQNKAWQNAGLPPIPVAVNVSGRQFQYARRLITALETVLGESGLEPRYLELELTESSAMRDADNAIAVVRQLKEMGIACSIDDFGTGYSSLSVLKRFPISKLKIDRSFVMDVITDPNDAAIVDAIIAMAQALKLKVVAEGVEHHAHLEFLRSLGCDQMQGYLFSRPLTAEAMGQLLAEGRRLTFTTATRQASTA